jgi:lipoprotein-anchoring transpeptidase ErfK/SrfK
MAPVKKMLRWLTVAGIAGATITLAPPVKAFFDEQLAPFGMSLPPLDGKDKIDPRTAIIIEAVGMGTVLAKAELRDADGKLLAEAAGQSRVVFDRPLAFGTRHTVKVTAERGWSNQSETREISFTTVAAPKLEGPPLRMLGPDASVTLRFDQPVGEVQASGELKLEAQADETRQTIRLIASNYAQDKTYPVQINWQTATGVPLPPLALELTTAPPLSADTNVKGLSNLGLALPLQVKFSEPLADRAEAPRNIQVHTLDGKPVAGRWDWQGPRQLKFTPQPNWPASSTIEVSAEPQALKSARGGMLDKPLATRFSTGADRRLFVYLNAQRVDAVENGQVVRSFKVSTGKAKTPTVTGNFYIYDRYRHKTMRSDVAKGQRGWYEVENVPYTQFFHKDFAFHGAFWHNGFGHPASHGCVNMATKDHNARWPSAPEDAGWLYQWAALGVPVTVTKESPVAETKEAKEAKPAAAKTASAASKAKPAAEQEADIALAPEATGPVAAKESAGPQEANPEP